MSDDAEQYRYDFRRPEMLAFVPVGITRLLDVGCATGAFVDALRERQPALETWGIEADPVAIRSAKQRIGTLIVGHFPEVRDQLPGGSFDCVVFNDVLEHMVEPDLALRAAAPLLTPSGRVIASIPNVRHVSVLAQLIGRGEFRYTDTGILDRTHLRFFTKRSILRLFGECGWHVEQIVGINWTPWARLPGWVQRRVSALMMGRLDDFLYQQYAVVARPMR